MRRFLSIVLLALPFAVSAQTVGEQYLLAAINEERVAHDLPPVRIDPSLVRAATLHAEQMVRHGAISHQFSGEPELATRGAEAGAHFSRIAENVAEGPSIIGLHDALMRSPGHRANILDPAVDAIGIAVLSRRGELYAVEEFARVVEPLTLEQQEAAVALLLDQAGLEILPSFEGRRTCALSSGYTGDHSPSFVMRYTTGDLSLLPEALTRRLRSGHERRATVGACKANASAFSQYSLAVLLFR